MHNEGQLQEYIILFNFVHFLLQSTKFYFYLDLLFVWKSRRSNCDHFYNILSNYSCLLPNKYMYQYVEP